MKDLNIQYQDNFAFVQVNDNMDYLRERYPEADEDQLMELLLTDASIFLKGYEFLDLEHGIEAVEKQRAVFHKTQGA